MRLRLGDSLPEPEPTVVEARAKTLPERPVVWVDERSFGFDVLDCPVRLLVLMPVPTTLRCSVLGREFIVTTSRAAFESATLPTLIGSELSVLADGGANERVYPVEFAEWIERKQGEPGFRLTLPLVRGRGVPSYVVGSGLDQTLGELFTRLWVKVLAVDVG